MKIENLKVINDLRGSLVPIEFMDLPFIPQRVFYVVDIPKGQTRGGHAHLRCLQYICCIKGKVAVTLDRGNSVWRHVIYPGQAVLVETMVWDTQKFLTGEDVLMVLCSRPYEPNDYILDYHKFIDLCASPSE